MDAKQTDQPASRLRGARELLRETSSHFRTVPRCNSCARPIAARWRRCPFCKSHTGSGYDPAHPFLDRRSSTLRAFGIGAAMWIFGAALLLIFSLQPVAATALGLLGLLVVLAHVFIPWLAGGWIAAELLWAAIAIGMLVALWPWGWTLAGVVMPLGVLGALLKAHRHQVARLTGQGIDGFRQPKSEVPKWTPCEWCGARDAEVVAPLYCLSVVTFTVRMPGGFRSLCLTHARVRAIPATLFTFAAGWWGIPWGPIWTVQCLVHNVETGGALLGSPLLNELREREKSAGGIDEESTPIDFCIGVVVGGIPFFALLMDGYFRLP